MCLVCTEQRYLVSTHVVVAQNGTITSHKASEFEQRTFPLVPFTSMRTVFFLFFQVISIVFSFNKFHSNYVIYILSVVPKLNNRTKLCDVLTTSSLTSELKQKVNLTKNEREQETFKEVLSSTVFDLLTPLRPAYQSISQLWWFYWKFLMTIVLTNLSSRILDVSPVRTSKSVRMVLILKQIRFTFFFFQRRSLVGNDKCIFCLSTNFQCFSSFAQKLRKSPYRFIGFRSSLFSLTTFRRLRCVVDCSRQSANR